VRLSASLDLASLDFLTDPQPSRRLHRLYTELPSLRLAASRGLGAKSRDTVFSKRGLGDLKTVNTAADVCPLCEGTGWKTIPARASAPKDRRVTRCDCQLRARNQTLLAAARIPKRYEHCELASYTTDFPGAHPSLAMAHLKASRFAQEYDPRDSTGLLMIGEIGTGKTHLAVGIIKELVRTKGVSCLFYDYRELLKEIQNSYSPSVQATEFGILRPVFDTEVLVIDELGGQTTSEWVWDTVSLIINTRYNDQKPVIITTNFENRPAAAAIGPDEPIDQFRTKSAARKYSLGDRVGERMRSRLHEMCRIVEMKGSDFRQTFRNANNR
jgi:DNA replication protein DnaC